MTGDIQFDILAAVVVILLAIAALAWLLRRLHQRTHRKLEDVHAETIGVRVRLERHSDEASHERSKMHQESKGFQAKIYRMFVEFLESVRGK